MVPKITNTGRSFKGAAAYYLHDKGATTTERVAWTHTENLLTDDAEKAWKVMAYTASHQAQLKRGAGVKATGRKLQKPVLAFSLAWHPDQSPDPSHMLEMAYEAVAAIGLEEHQAIYVVHNDEPHDHIHVLINRVHPEHGKAASLSNSKRKIQAWALAYEKEHGQIFCPAREENARQRGENKTRPSGQKTPVNGRDPVIAAAWQQADNGKAFVAALTAEGYQLAQGRQRLVVVDRYGKAHNPTRHLPGVRAKDFNARLADVDTARLPTVAEVQEQIASKGQARLAPAFNALASKGQAPAIAPTFNEAATEPSEKQPPRPAAKALASTDKKPSDHQVKLSREFDLWAAQVLNETQNRQNEERVALQKKYEQQVKEKQADLANHYEIRKLRGQIDRLRAAVKHPSLARRLSGRAKQDREQLQALLLTFNDAKTRMEEAVAAIEARKRKDTVVLDQQHQQEQERAKALIAQRKPQLDREAREQARGGKGKGRGGGGGRSGRSDGPGREVHRTPPTRPDRSGPFSP